MFSRSFILFRVIVVVVENGELGARILVPTDHTYLYRFGMCVCSQKQRVMSYSVLSPHRIKD